MLTDHPIIFSAAMVRAILARRKTQTRRVVNARDFASTNPPRVEVARCPYGRVGGTLWVRETCRAETLQSGAAGVRYRMDDTWRSISSSRTTYDEWLALQSYRHGSGCWVPSIFMPYWASRLTLEITAVRVQRVQDISAADAIAEGVDAIENGVDPQLGFRVLWNNINAKRGYGWDNNPWVWAITFTVKEDA